MNPPKLSALMFTVAFVACGARTPAVQNPSRGAGATRAVAPLRPAVIHVLARDWSCVTDGGPPEFHALGGIAGCDGARGITGDLRAEVHGSSVALSEPGPTVDNRATETADGWIFWGSADGRSVLFASERFTGTLRPIGRVPAGVGSMSDDSRGRAVLLAHERGALWTADLHGITWVESLPGPVASAAFDDANRGAAVLRDGALHETRDGGRRGDASLSGLTSRCASRTTGARCASPRTGRGSPSTPGA